MDGKYNREQQDMVPIAIIGQSCRLPGSVSTPEEFWRFCCQAKSAWSAIPSTRFSADAYYHPNPDQQGTTHTQGGHFLEDVTKFDASFFGMTAEEAMVTDPQQRLILECGYEAIENAGISMSQLAGERVGVFVAGSFSDYELSHFKDLQSSPAFQAPGCAASFLSNRLSHFGDFTGPSLTVDTACSSSLTALHLACQSLRSGESTYALVAGCHLNLTPDYFISYSLTRLFSDTGRCYPFDYRGDSGYGRGEGVACVMLRRLDDALEAGDSVRAIIAATGVNQDGHTNGIGVPNPTAQRRLIEAVYKAAKVSPEECGFVEAHGTGTKVGDPLEAHALYKVFGTGRSPQDPVLIGSVKSNFGHAEGASGLISLIKTVLMLEKGHVLPNCDFERPKDEIPLEAWNLRVPTNLLRWPEGKPYASINNFGFGGTNAHALLKRATLPTPQRALSVRQRAITTRRSSEVRKLFVFSGHTEHVAMNQARNIAAYLQQHPDILDRNLLANLCYTLCERRSMMPWKITVSARSTRDLIACLTTGKLGARRSINAPNVGFVFTGQGAHWYGMGRQLFGAYPVFAKSVQRAEEHLFQLQAGFSLIEELHRDKETSLLSDPRIGQPACTAIQIALTDLLRSWGISPQATIGHSSGEIAAAYAANILSLEDAMTLAYSRGAAAALVGTLAPDSKGGMLAIRASLMDTKALIDEVAPHRATIACVNSPNSITVSGDMDAISAFQDLCDSRSIVCRRLDVGVAYHSHHMERVADHFKSMIMEITPSDSEVAFYSSARACRLNGSELDPSYWVRGFVTPVQFWDGLMALLREESLGRAVDCLIEIGPHSALERSIKEILQVEQWEHPVDYLHVLRNERDALETMHEMAEKIVLLGYPLRFRAVNFPLEDSGMPPRQLNDLPPYAWNHTQEYWHASRIARNISHPKYPRHPLIGLRSAEGSDLHPQWRMILRVDDHPWVRQHQFYGHNIYPMAGYVAMAMEAALQQAKHTGIDIDSFCLREVSAGKALEISNDGVVEIMVLLQPHPGGTRSLSSTWQDFSIASWTEERGWEENCRGIIAVSRAVAPNPVNGEALSRDMQRATAEKLDAIARAADKKVKPEAMYDELLAHGVNYGRLFRGMNECWAHDGIALATATVPDATGETSCSPAAEIFLHPATLDICFQIVWLALGAGTNRLGTEYLVSFIKRLTVPHIHTIPPGSRLQIYGEQSGTVVSGFPVEHNIWATSTEDSRQIILHLEGLVMTPMHNQQSSVPSGEARQLCFRQQLVPCIDLTTRKPILEGSCHGMELTGQRQTRLITTASQYYLQRAAQAMPVDSSANVKRSYGWLLQFASNKIPVAADTVDLDNIRKLGVAGRVVCELGDKLPRILAGESDPSEIVQQAGGIDAYSQDIGLSHILGHVAELVDNFGLQDPEQTILELGTAAGSATLPILEKVGREAPGTNHRFQRYVIATPHSAFSRALKSRLEESAGLIRHEKWDVSADLVGQGCQAGEFSLVILWHEPFGGAQPETLLHSVAQVMKPGGKLIIITRPRSNGIELPLALLQQGHSTWESSMSEVYSEHKWDTLLRSTGFSPSESLADACVGTEETGELIVSTLRGSDNPLSNRRVSIVYNGELEWFPLHALREELSAETGRIVQVKTLNKISKVDDLCIFLGEIEQPLLANMTPEQFEKIQCLLTSAPEALWVIRNAYANSQSPTANMAVGLIRTVRLETGSPIGVLDTDMGPSTAASHIVDEIIQVLKCILRVGMCANKPDLEFTSRGGVVFVPRIMQDTATNDAVYQDPSKFTCSQQPLIQRHRPLRLAIREYGMLSSLYFTDNAKLTGPIEDGHIELDVHFVGLNFKDVMAANNQIPLDGFGIECSGVVTAVGNHVDGLSVGDRVCTISEGCFATRTRCPRASAWKVPDTMDLDIAASVPVIYCTAVYCLSYVARLTAGETILIHAAAGGVGQAAVVLAQRIGATIFATVSSSAKKKVLVETYSIPESHIFFSRDLSFVDGVRLATNGRGVDVVLNSISGDAMRASVECLAPFGRFVEIGKRDAMENSHLELSAFDRNLSFSSVDLSVFAHERPQLMQKLFFDAFEIIKHRKGELATQINRFEVSRVESAFQMLQSGHSTGKIVVAVRDSGTVTVHPAARGAGLLTADGSYLVIGAGGGIGQSITSWLTMRGARNLILVSRTESSIAAMQPTVGRLRQESITVRVVKCDISDRRQVREVLLPGLREMPPVVGVIHTAMVVRDTVFDRMNFEDFAAVTAPKVTGLQNLTSILDDAGSTLDFFIALSSIIGVVGNPGQAAYAAASTFIDAFAQEQRACGVPFTAVDLCPVWDIGYLAVNPEVREQARNIGSDGITESELHRILSAVIFSRESNQPPNDHLMIGLGVSPTEDAQAGIEWLADRRFAHIRASQSLPKTTVPPGDISSANTETLGLALKRAKSAKEAQEIVENALLCRLAEVAMCPVDEIDKTKPIAACGIDSLSAIGFRRWIMRELDASPSLFDILNSPSVPALAAICCAKTQIAIPRDGL